MSSSATFISCSNKAKLKVQGEVRRMTEAKHFSIMEAAAILATLRGEDDHFALMEEFGLIHEGQGEWIVSVPADFSSLLLDLDELDGIAEVLSEMTQEEVGWSNDEFKDFLLELQKFAGQANARGEQLYLHMSL